jgi:hypothetical protein
MFGNKSENKRFITVHEEGTLGSRFKVIVDKETGVNYLINIDGYSGGITVLLDKDGKPIVSPIK